MLDNVHATGLSTTELIDIVDEDDNVIDTVARSKDILDTKVVRGVHVYVQQSDGKIVMQQRMQTKHISPLAFDASAGGHCKAGQTYDEGAKDELLEEMGITLQTMTYLGKTKAYWLSTQNLCAFVGVYLVQHDGPYKNWQNEAERLEFFTLEELKLISDRFPYLFTNWFHTTFTLLKNHLNNTNP